MIIHFDLFTKKIVRLLILKNNFIMSIKRDRMKWECVANHLPDWIEDNDARLHCEMTPQELDRMEVLLDMYNSLSDKEETRLVVIIILE